jgi:enoyl-CoA hydratase/carnithine racemase
VSAPGGDPSPEVVLERLGPVARITINRPERRNALGAGFTAAMMARLDEIEGDPNVGAVILTGAGTVFCGGGDLFEIMSTEPGDAARDLTLIRGYNRVVARLRRLDVPVVAAVNGPAVGGGAALALVCDIAIASDRASYAFAFERIGLAAADMGCAALLVRALGPLRAAHLTLTSGTLSAVEAMELGLVAEVVEHDRLPAAAERLAQRIAAGPRRANAATKLAIHRGAQMDLETVLEYEAYVQAVQFSEPEHKQRLGAFLTGKEGG